MLYFCVLTSGQPYIDYSLSLSLSFIFGFFQIYFLTLSEPDPVFCFGSFSRCRFARPPSISPTSYYNDDKFDDSNRKQIKLTFGFQENLSSSTVFIHFFSNWKWLHQLITNNALTSLSFILVRSCLFTHLSDPNLVLTRMPMRLGSSSRSRPLFACVCSCEFRANSATRTAKSAAFAHSKSIRWKSSNSVTWNCIEIAFAAVTVRRHFGNVLVISFHFISVHFLLESDLAQFRSRSKTNATFMLQTTLDCRITH